MNLRESHVPAIRVRVANRLAVNSGNDFVLYWMIANRRARWNFSLERAVEWARALNKPLVVLEALRCGYRWASDRLHHFIIQGMADNLRDFQGKGPLYYPYVEPKPGDGQGLLAALAKRSCVVISDDFPCFVVPPMVQAANRHLPVRFELVDSNGLLPLRAADKVYARAVDFRRFLQRCLIPHLADAPKPAPLSRVRLASPPAIPSSITRRWPVADVHELAIAPGKLRRFSIDHAVGPVTCRGGAKAGQLRLRRFIQTGLPQYSQSRNRPELEVTSGLSPYLHFGHVSVHQVFAEIVDQHGWSHAHVAGKASGAREGWWGAAPEVEAFFDELITWRELGYNMCWQRDDYDQFESLPDWSQKTLARHASDPREHVYTLGEFERAATHDVLWNAAQRQLVTEGRIHNYLRMLWGKKILEWSGTPRDALDVMIELNNKYALDGRNPNSYSGIFWVLGRYDRAWGPERPIYGKVRYMSSDNTARKVRVVDYIRRFGGTMEEP